MLGGDATQLPNWNSYGVNYITYKYDEDGRILLESYYANKSISKKISYIYNEDTIIKNIEKGSKTKTYTYRYHSSGKLLSQSEVFDDKTYTIYTYEYDEKLNITQSKELSFNYENSGELRNQTELLTTYENFYDELGTLIKVIEDEKYIWERVLLF